MKTDISFDASAVEEAFLVHYGIKGMHWGIRRDAYLDARRAKNQEKAQEYIQKAERLETKIIDLQAQKRTVKGYKRGRIQDEISRARVSQKEALGDAQRFQEGKRLTAKQAHRVRTAAFVGGTLAAYGLYSATQSGNVRRLAQMGKRFVLNDIDVPFRTTDKYSSKQLTAREIELTVIPGINPGYGRPGTKMNCRRATIAYEMRRRWYDVSATKTTNARGQDTGGLYNTTNPGRNNVPAGLIGISTRYMLDKGKRKLGIGDTDFSDRIDASPEFTRGFHDGSVPPVDHLGQSFVTGGDIFDSLAKLPDRARGELGVAWNGGGGHSMAFEIVDGKPVIFDAQSGARYSQPDQLTAKFGRRIAEAGFTRLDDLELNPDFLMRWLRNA